MDQRGKKRSRFDNDSTLVYMTTENGILPGFESFEILTKACCPHPGTLLDFRFIHDPKGIAQPFALVKIAGGQRGDASLVRLMRLNGRRIGVTASRSSRGEGGISGGSGGEGTVGARRVTNTASVSASEERSSPLINDYASLGSNKTIGGVEQQLTLRVTIEHEDILRLEAAAAAAATISVASSSSVDAASVNTSSELNGGQPPPSSSSSSSSLFLKEGRENEEESRSLIEHEIARIQEGLLFRSQNTSSNNNSNNNHVSLTQFSHNTSSVAASSSSSSSLLSSSSDSVPFVSSSISEGTLRDSVVRFKQQQQIKARERDLHKKSLFELDVRRIVETGKRYLQQNLTHHHHQQQQKQPSLISYNHSTSNSGGGGGGGGGPPLPTSSLVPNPNKPLLSSSFSFSSSSSSSFSSSSSSSSFKVVDDDKTVLSKPLPSSIFQGDTLDRLALPLLLAELRSSLGVGAEEEAAVAKQILNDLRTHKSATTLFTDIKDLLEEKEAKTLVYRLWDALVS